MTDWNIRFWEYDFYQPIWLWLLVLVPVFLILMFRYERKSRGQIKFSGTLSTQHLLGTNWIVRVRELVIVMYGFSLVLLILALGKPFHWSMHNKQQKNYKDGIDIVIAIDVSGSMLAQDFQPNRLEASKEVAKEFVNGRNGDRIGLVAYAGEAYTACPPTLDYEILKQQIEKLSGDHITGGTAIGIGLGTAVTRLRSDTLSSKVIILLTDGVDGGAEITPIMAAELAQAKNIRVYTIGVGSVGQASTLVQSPFGSYYQMMDVEIDEVTLKQIASITGGNYFRATDKESLRIIYQEIEKLEKRKMENEQFKAEPPATPAAFLNWAFLLMLGAWLINRTLFREND